MAYRLIHSRSREDLRGESARRAVVASRRAVPTSPSGIAARPRLMLVAIGTLALGALARRFHIGARRRPAADEAFRRALSERSETAALLRICHAILCEFAQPLSGVLVYSELLQEHAPAIDEGQRYELRELREGALQLERLLLTLREAMRAGASLESSSHVAAHIEHAIAQPRSTMPTRIA